MGEERWTASLRSTAGLVIGPVVGLPSMVSLVTGNGLSLLGVVFLLGAIVIWLSSAVLRLVVGSDGIAVRPAGPRIAWDSIEGFEVAGTFQGTVHAFQHGMEQPTLLNAQPLRPRRARQLVERLNAELSAS